MSDPHASWMADTSIARSDRTARNTPLPSSAPLLASLERLATGVEFAAGDWQQLEQYVLQDQARAAAFGITATTVTAAVRSRAQLFQRVEPRLVQFCEQELHLPLDRGTLWDLWLPLAMRLAAQRQALGRSFIQGILGGQGTGKTTLSKVLTLILQVLGYQTVSLSLDDLYKTYADRQQLLAIDPRLHWRGPPGTHDVALGIDVLDRLRQATPDAAAPAALIPVPRFDKSLHGGAGDRVAPEYVAAADIVLFEGWFVGVRPIDPAQFETAPPPILTEADRGFARDTNARLQAYLPLWQRLDSLIVLYPENYRLSQQWRKQAEQAMRATGKAGMTDAEIDQFVEYFWKALHPELFITPLVHHADGADLVIEIQANHIPGAVQAENR